MYSTEHEDERRLLKSRWETGVGDRVAFLYRTDDHYHYLLAQAEAYQLGLICLSERQEMVTHALAPTPGESSTTSPGKLTGAWAATSMSW
ncbi:hypothetical protein A6723_010870 [Pseudomonas sp. AU11447]|nr:hypothetical protein A6723_010870 [Pseudomonas sp. AU11447]